MSDLLLFPVALPIDPLSASYVPAGNDWAIQLASGQFVSVQPDGSVQTRQLIGPWEVCRRVSERLVSYSGAGQKWYFVVEPTTIAPAPPLPIEIPSNSFALPPSADVTNYAGRAKFVTQARLLAYGEITQDDLMYWLAKADEMIARGIELGEGLNYFWTRLLGRGAGGADVAKFGPYKGLAHYEGPLV